MNKIILLCSFSTRSEAEIAKSLLRANNIDSIIQADDAGGMYPFPTILSGAGVRLYVNKNKLKEGKELLNLQSNNDNV
jgi:hypothetical protein